MIQVKDKFFLKITFNGEEYPIEKTGFGFFQVSTNVSYYVPMVRIQLNDPQKLFKERFTLADQTPVVIVYGINPGDENAVTLKLRVFEFTAVPQKANMVYTIDLIMDSVKFLSDSVSVALVDGVSPIHSYEAIQKIAQECGFATVKLSKTVDRQLWLPGGKKYCAYAKEIAEVGYVDTSSCMVLCVTADSTLKYQNISAIDRTKGPLFTHRIVSSTQEYQIMGEIKEVTKSGLINNLYGHGQRTIDQTANKQYKAVSAKIETSGMLINKDINTSIRPRTLFTPIDCGNTHSNYNLAKHQNMRIKSFYSFSLLVAISRLSPLDLLDVIQYDGLEAHSTSTSASKPQLSGAYTITAKTVYITGRGLVYEKFEITRPGLNDDPGKSKSQLGS